MSKLAIVFDGPPSHGSGRFVEVELNGQSIKIGEWQQNGDLWELVLSEHHAHIAMLDQFVINADETAKALIEQLQGLRELQGEIEPYAVRLDPEVVMNKSTPSLPHLAEWVEKFLTIMRSE